jgi:hypothetical protein
MDGEVNHSHDCCLPLHFFILILFTMQHYTTTDLCLAAVLSLYYPLAGAEHQGVAFVFQCDDFIESLVEQYHRGDLTVEPHTFYMQVEALRATQAVHRSITW